MTDTYYDNTVLMLPFDQETYMAPGVFAYDYSRRHATPVKVGNATLSSDFQYGDHALSLDGVGSYLEVVDNNIFNFGTGDFTVEFWVKTSVVPIGYQRIIAPAINTNIAGGFQLWFSFSTDFASTAYAVCLAYPTGTGYTVDTQAAINDGVYHHVAFCRASGTSRCFLDGVLKQSASDTNDYNLTQGYKIGARGDLNVDTFFNGLLDDLRVTNGIARYTVNFTPPLALKGDYSAPLAFGGHLDQTLFSKPGFNYWLLPKTGELIPEFIYKDASYADITWGGDGIVSGIARIGSAPVKCQVRLYEAKAGAFIKATWSNDDGTYQFIGMSKNILYTVTATDSTNTYNDVIAAKVRAV